MKPFLLLSIRAEKAAAEDEHAAFARYLGDQHDLVRRQLGAEDCSDLPARVGEYAGILLGGGSFTCSDDSATKSSAQRRAEADLWPLLDEVVRRDSPFLGACYGIGTLGTHQGGLVDRIHSEPVGPLVVSRTDAGASDELFSALPHRFAAYGGHKEALRVVPAHLTVLATSTACPVQAFRVGQHVYATQFHPELDLAGLLTRIEVYSSYGYFEPSDAAALAMAAKAVEVSHPMALLREFADRYAG